MHFTFSRPIALFLMVFCLGLYSITTVLAQEKTVVNGVVKDKQTNELLPFANVVFTGTGRGAVTDIDGKFSLSSTDPSHKSITISFLGYETTSFPIEAGTSQEVTFMLPPDARLLEAVVIKGEKKVRKDTAAMRLFRKAVRKAEESQPDYYAYEDYTKMEFDLYNVSEKLMNRKILRPFSFIFENMDTTDAGTPFLPVMLKEKISEVFFRKQPKKRKEILKATQFSGVGDADDTEVVDEIVSDFNVFEKVLVIGDKSFISPLTRGSQISYKYFLTDTAVVEQDTCYKLQFTPKRKGDLCFTGHAWIEKETAGIKSVELFLLDQANLNFVTDLRISQKFQRMENNIWFKYFDQMVISMNILENKEQQAIRVVQTSSRDKIRVNQPLEEKLFKGENLIIDEMAYKQPKTFWTEHRHTPLNKNEAHIYTLMDRVQATPAYKRYEWIGNMLSSGFMRFGPVEIGKYHQFISWNELEGTRVKVGFRANRKMFRKYFDLDGYLAYGDKDELIKYHLGGRKMLKRVNNKWHAVGASYRYDWSDYNARNPWRMHDYTLASFMRTRPLNDLFLMRRAHLFYEKEWIRGLSTKLSGTHKTVYSWPGSYEVNLPETVDSLSSGDDNFKVLELNFYQRIAIGQKFIENARGEQNSVKISTPILTVDYTISPKGILGSDYNYQKVVLGLTHQLNSFFGRTRYEMEYGKVFGNVPYALLKIHSGNETYGYEKNRYNLMNEFEFASDQWASLKIYHRFDGLIFNAIPLIKKLKLRSMADFRLVYGSMTPENQRYLELSNGLKNLNGFYSEASVGVGNIAKAVSVAFTWRLTQLDQPNVVPFGVKIAFSPSF